MRSLITLSIAAVALFGCTKVIDVNLNEANEKYVIEANYSAEDSTVRVLITKTSSFFDNNASPKVNNGNYIFHNFIIHIHRCCNPLKS